jgi:hypothetical protein
MSFNAYSIANHKNELFIEGLTAVGYKFKAGDPPAKVNKGDVLIAWNRKEFFEKAISRFEAAGGTAIIAENGFIGSDDEGNRLISLAVSKHHGLGRWFIGEEKRFLKQNINILPWQETGEELVILGQRGIGETSVKADWAFSANEFLRHRYKMPVRVRQHPAKDKSKPIEEDIKSAFAVVTYSSSAAIKAIAAGVPAFYGLKGWIGRDAAVYGMDSILSPYKGCRETMFHKIGWHQWTQKEIATGEAFRALSNI